MHVCNGILITATSPQMLFSCANMLAVLVSRSLSAVIPGCRALAYNPQNKGDYFQMLLVNPFSPGLKKKNRGSVENTHFLGWASFWKGTWTSICPWKLLISKTNMKYWWAFRLFMHAGLTTRVSEAYKIYTSPLLLSQVGREAVFYLQWYPGWAQHKMGSFGAILTFVVLETDLKWSSLALKSWFFSLACLLSAWIIGMYHHTLQPLHLRGENPPPSPNLTKQASVFSFFHPGTGKGVLLQ